MPLIKSISGIRGTIGGKPGDNLTPIDIVYFTSAFATFLSKRLQKETLTLVVGRDARISGEIVRHLVCATLQSMGVHIIDLGLSTTPTVEMAVTTLKSDGGIIITASHNPMEWNALKLLNEKGEFISAREGEELLKLIEEGVFTYASVEKLGNYSLYENAIADHVNAILKLDLVDQKAIAAANFKVALDAVNSTGGLAISLLFEKLGIENFTILNGEPTGIFPHNPEPLAENLHEICNLLAKQNFDVGFAVDPDVDRLAIITENGEIFGEEYTLVAIADYVLQNNKGNTVSNLSSSRALRDVSRNHHVDYFTSAVGEVNVIEKMKETNAIIGGEGNGGVIYPALHYGRDALVGIALFLSFMAKTKKKCSEIKKLYPVYYISKNRIALPNQVNVAKILDYLKEKYADYKITTIDGVKIDFDDSWLHIRSSNTEPIIRIYAEATSESTSQILTDNIISDIREFLNR